MNNPFLVVSTHDEQLTITPEWEAVLSTNEKKVYKILATANSGVMVDTSMKTLARVVGMSVNAFKNTIEELERKGLLTIS